MRRIVPRLVFGASLAFGFGAQAQTSDFYQGKTIQVIVGNPTGTGFDLYARALAQQPRLLLADEPVASLDPATADKVMTLLHTICKEDGISAVVSLHQVELARRYADRIVGLAQGRIVCDVAPESLTQENAHALYQQAPQTQLNCITPQAGSRIPFVFNAVEEM